MRTLLLPCFLALLLAVTCLHTEARAVEHDMGIMLYAPAFLSPRPDVTYYTNPGDSRIVSLSDNAKKDEYTFYGLKNDLGEATAVESHSYATTKDGAPFEAHYGYSAINKESTSALTDIWTNEGHHIAFSYDSQGNLTGASYTMPGLHISLPVSVDSKGNLRLPPRSVLEAQGRVPGIPERSHRVGAIRGEQEAAASVLAIEEVNSLETLTMDISLSTTLCGEAVRTWGKLHATERENLPGVESIGFKNGFTPFTLQVPRTAAPEELSQDFSEMCNGFWDYKVTEKVCQGMNGIDLSWALIMCRAFSMVAGPYAPAVVAVCPLAVYGLAGAQLLCTGGGKLICEATTDLLDRYVEDAYTIYASATHPLELGADYEEQRTVDPSTAAVAFVHDFQDLAGSASGEITPSNPWAGESYRATGAFTCVEPGATLDVLVSGTDGYSDIASCTAGDTSATCSIEVPGGMSNVKDTIEFAVDGTVVATSYVVFPEEVTAVGDWQMTYDWWCDGAYVGTSTWRLAQNGTFTTTTGFHGTWSQNNDSVTVVYANGTTYSGRMTRETYMSGTMFDGDGEGDGCWHAERSLRREPLSAPKSYSGQSEASAPEKP